jgi:DNA-binding NarL/FixJ family response regulator
MTLEKLKELSSLPVILLTMNDEKAIIEETFKKGAQGYLHKNCTTAELKNAIESVLQGGLFMSEEIKKIVVGLKQPTTTGSLVLSEPLTDKEFEVLQLICEGLSSKEIGEKLFLSPRTVETRKQSLMDKFDVRTTGKLIAYAIKNKIVK